MTRVLVALLALVASLLQVSVVPALVSNSLAAPLLPLALLAAWGEVRRPSELLTALPVIAITLGVASQQRVGWFLLAGVPVVAAGLAVPETMRPASRLASVPVVAVVGTIAYLVMLLAVDGRVTGILAASVEVATASVTTAFLAGLFAVLAWPLRDRSRNLFA